MNQAVRCMGLMRVRGFVQDDAHIFCTEDQIVDEARAFNELLVRIYKQFGFHDVAVKLSLRPDNVQVLTKSGIKPNKVCVMR